MPDLQVTNTTRVGNQVTVTGIATANQTVTISAGTTLLGTAVAGNNQQWTFTFTYNGETGVNATVPGKDAEPIAIPLGLPLPN